MAALVMQSLGCEVAALNTVQYSQPLPSCLHLFNHQPLMILPGNHTGYGQWRGTKTTGEEILDLYAGLENAGLNNDFQVLLSGYLPSAEAVEAVGHIARDLRRKRVGQPGRFFWGRCLSQVHEPSDNG